MTLEEFIEESIKCCAMKEYVPFRFLGMKEYYLKNGFSLVAVIKKLVVTSDPKSDYLKMVALGLKRWTLEAAVIRYPEKFDRLTIEYARMRLNGFFDYTMRKRMKDDKS